MALEEINKDAISFKRLSGKAHTQFGFDVTEEGISSNIQIALTTVFGQEVNPNPATNGGLTSFGDNDSIVEKVRFEIDIIPDTAIGTNQSQGYRLKLPAGYSGVLSSDFPAGTYLYEALGKLQIVPSLYGELKPDGSTEYEPTLYDSNLNVIPKFDPINWNLDSYSGVLFVQDPPTSFDGAPERPTFIDAYLYVGQYLDKAITGASATVLSAGRGISTTDFDDDIVSVDLQNYTAPSNMLMTFTGANNTFVIRDNSDLKHGVKYAANYAPTFQPRSLVDKAYVDSIASGLSVRDAVRVATTGNTNLGSVTTIDGVTLEDGYRVLVKNQTDARQNGIYVWNSGTTSLTRSIDFDQSSEVISGAFTSVLSGDTNIATIWAVSTPDPISLGTDTVDWIKLALPLTYFGGVGINVNGNEIELDGETLAGIGLGWDGTAFNIDIGGANLGTGETIFRNITTEGETETFNFRSIVGSGGTNVSLSNDGNEIILFTPTGDTGSGILGEPTDGTYSDGLFQFIIDNTTVDDAIDDINEFLLSLAPPFAPQLDSINTISNFVSGNLSFGASKGINTYTNVGGLPIGSAVDVNGLYETSGNRAGIINGSVTGVLNNDVNDGDNSTGIPYENDAFNKANEGSIVLELNGNIISSLDLTTGSGALSNTEIAVSEIKFSKFSTGAEFNQAPYRTGTYNVQTSFMDNGWNYLRVIHSGTSSGDIDTNYLEWVYDPNSNNISGSTGVIDNIVLNGSKLISGVEYHLNGNVDYNVTISNAYRNVYSDSNNAIQFVNTNNLSPDISLFGMDIIGTGINNSIGQVNNQLPILDTGVSDAEITNISIDATLQINSNRILGSIGTLGNVTSSITVLHPFTSKRYIASSTAIETGFLLYNISDSSSNQNENFTGENNRIQDTDYTSLSYAQVNGSTYDWDSSQDLISGNTQHNTGMLVFDGSLYYPSSALLDDYGILNGDFSSLTYSPIGNPDYSNATGNKVYYRRFKQDLTQSLGELTFTIAHDGNASTFLTQGSNVIGAPTGDQIAFEFYVIRTNDTTFGYGNPFAQFDNPDGIQNTSTSHSGGVTTVNVNLGLNRTDNNDIIIVRMKFASGYTQSVSNVAITNI